MFKMIKTESGEKEKKAHFCKQKKNKKNPYAYGQNLNRISVVFSRFVIIKKMNK